MFARRPNQLFLTLALGAALVAGTASAAEAGRRKVIEGTAIGAGLGGVLGLIVAGPRGGLAGAAVGGVAGAVIASSQPDCHWRVNSRGRHYRICH